MITLEGIDPKMIANNLTPFEPTHPGEMIKDEVEYRGLSQKKLAAEMGMSPSLLNEILNGRRRVSTEPPLGRHRQSGRAQRHRDRHRRCP